MGVARRFQQRDFVARPIFGGNDQETGRLQSVVAKVMQRGSHVNRLHRTHATSDTETFFALQIDRRKTLGNVLVAKRIN